MKESYSQENQEQNEFETSILTQTNLMAVVETVLAQELPPSHKMKLTGLNILAFFSTNNNMEILLTKKDSVLIKNLEVIFQAIIGKNKEVIS